MATEISVIGGSGLYDLEEIKSARDVHVETPFGPAALVVGIFGGREVAFVSRHGRGHRVGPAFRFARPSTRSSASGSAGSSALAPSKACAPFGAGHGHHRDDCDA